MHCTYTVHMFFVHVYNMYIHVYVSDIGVHTLNILFVCMNVLVYCLYIHVYTTSIHYIDMYVLNTYMLILLISDVTFAQMDSGAAQKGYCYAARP
jgi:hypothetical protein